MSDKCTCKTCNVFRDIDEALKELPEIAKHVKNYLAQEGFQQDCETLDYIRKIERLEQRLAESEAREAELVEALLKSREFISTLGAADIVDDVLKKPSQAYEKCKSMEEAFSEKGEK